MLDQGGSTLDAVEQAVLMMEGDPVFDAGTGGFLNRDGDVQLDALMIDGAKLDFGATAGGRRIKNPITCARRVMERSEQVSSMRTSAPTARTIQSVRSRLIGTVTSLLSKFSCDRMAAGLSAQDAAVHFENRFPKSMSEVIVIDPMGRCGIAEPAPKLSCAWVNEDDTIV